MVARIKSDFGGRLSTHVFSINSTIDAIDAEYRHQRPKMNRDSLKQNLAVC
jgi:hypothetical protein